MEKVNKIIIESYKEFTDEVQCADDMVKLENVIVAKEIEAVIEQADGVTFSLGFTVMRDNPIFKTINPRDMVREFFKNHLS
ncbi:hypothetical protein 031MP002_43 [Bacillus phage 031MP002]|nr:hypothetical protein 031MP003_44 [Bacillus phage 031MP003]QFG05533.1 hypothetical protein 031MP002_43 [Bacillus phage 031MP002]